MNLKKFALRGLAVLAVFVALCMFFSGTIKTITTAKIKITRAKTGRLEEKTELSGKLAFPEVDHVRYALEAGQSLTISRVNTRPGYTVKEGDVIIEAAVSGYDGAMTQYQAAYDDALDQLLLLESKNANLRLRRSDEEYANAFFALRDARKAAAAAKMAMDSLLNRERLALPETGAPEGASDALIAAIAAWRDAVAAEASAQTAMDGASRYVPDDATWAYISDRKSLQEKMDDAEQKMAALSELNSSVAAICAPHDGYIAEVLVKEGDAYDGLADLFTLTKPDALPVLRADLSKVTRTVSEGAAVTLSTDRGAMETKVLSTGIDEEGRKYADVALTGEIVSAMGSVYSMTMEETPLSLVNRAAQSTSLLTASAVHGTGDDRYIYTVDKVYSSFGNTKMTVHKMTVTVLAEAGGLVSIQEELGYYDVAYMEDRPISDGDTVMEYID